MLEVRTAILAVSDKTGIVELAKALADRGVTLIGTSGTAKLLRQASIAAGEISEVTGSPQMLDGRLKTLHPMIHGGLQYLRDNETHQREIRQHGIRPIDMVVVNLYPFEEVSTVPHIPLDRVLQNIDVGGPALVRSAAKNYRSVAVITSPAQYASVLAEIRNDGGIGERTLEQLAVAAFDYTARYDKLIHEALQRRLAS
jgi:phosphoribosylaminoimidazolecarboxamide formyltransferase/IMP cyclohydrolase